MRRLGFGAWSLLAVGGGLAACGDDAAPPAATGGAAGAPAASSSAPPAASSSVPPPPASSSSAPPVPSAPALLQSAPGTFFDRVRYLVEGSSARQQGVAAGAITPKRAALVRGTVIDRDGKPLAGVTVRAPRSTGLGFTTTLADGSWDFVVEGGEPVLVQMDKAGYLTSQRWARPLWNRYDVVEPVALLRASDKATEVSFGAATWQTARGETSSDASGKRTATVLFPPGVKATATSAAGQTSALAKGTFRVTEFTVGDRGPAAMPGNLPPASGYTYASDFAFDEA